MEEDQDPDQIVLHQQGHTDAGMERLVCQGQEPMLVALVVVDHDSGTLTNNLARQPLAGRQVEPAIIAAQAVADHQLEAAVLAEGINRSALGTAGRHRPLEQRTQHVALVSLLKQLEAGYRRGRA